MPQPASADFQGDIRVLIVDDEATVRSSLRYFLLAFDDLECVGEAGSAEEALALCVQARPNIVLIDLMMQDVNAVDLVRTIRQHWPRTTVIALTSLWTDEAAQEVLEAGASGYLLKTVSAEELAGVIRAAHVRRPSLGRAPWHPLPNEQRQPC
jgi:NarL family two-component system response regulator LiaR